LIITKPLRILISDFDGTVTRFDFYDLICQAYPHILSAGHWQRFESGEITHFEALRRIFAEIRASEQELLTIIAKMEIASNLKEDVGNLQKSGWEVIVASAGCDWYIRRLLAQHDVAISVHSNPGTFSPKTGLTLSLPLESPFFCSELGINKVAIVQDAIKRSRCVAFAGDGRPDLAPALLVPPHLRFARKWLAQKLKNIGEDYRPFECWHEVAHALCQEER
jgi:2-hydroxy-3-keto-5-methylthiopentenyl-1-phosphate phosphatase